MQGEHHSDYWRVNSYGYPNPFNTQRRSQEAWTTLLSFFEHSSYSDLKTYWASPTAPRILRPHAVESWKAAFEEFGLLYVLSGSDGVHITPAGDQFRDAAERGQRQELAWIGLSLLLRYPLRGPRRVRGPRHKDSDLLLYWFLYAAMRQLNNYFWRSELDRVLCKVFQTGEAEDAVADILRLRGGEASLDDFPPPSRIDRGGFYNSLNQVIVHASMNFLMLEKIVDDSLYEPGTAEKRIRILRDWVPSIDMALGGSATSADCDERSQFVSRMPSAPDFEGDENAYFEYLGAEVAAMPTATSGTSINYAIIEGGKVAVLRANVHYTVHSSSTISGSVSYLCRLARNQRIILSHNLRRSYIIENKALTGPDEVTITVRAARPIINTNAIYSLLEDSND